MNTRNCSCMLMAALVLAACQPSVQTNQAGDPPELLNPEIDIKQQAGNNGRILLLNPETSSNLVVEQPSLATPLAQTPLVVEADQYGLKVAFDDTYRTPLVSIVDCDGTVVVDHRSASLTSTHSDNSSVPSTESDSCVPRDLKINTQNAGVQ